MDVLVIGAGGLGCEIIKNLVLYAQRLTIVDLDVVEKSNLNRQCLYTDNDVGVPKAEAAARSARSLAPKCKIDYLVKRVEDLPVGFYSQFSVVVCGLDSVNARRHVNNAVVTASRQKSTVIPLIDGGCEGLEGQCRVIIPFEGPCYECTLDLNAESSGYPLCTLASVPRLPEHCVLYASEFEFPLQFKTAANFENQADVEFVTLAAQKRAAKFGISGINPQFVIEVLAKRIPSVSCANSIIGGICALEALKLHQSKPAKQKTNYIVYSGISGANTIPLTLARNPNCVVCSTSSLTANPNAKLSTILQNWQQLLALNSPPSVTCAERVLYMPAPLVLEKATRANLDMPLSDLISPETSEVVLAHKSLATPVRVYILP